MYKHCLGIIIIQLIIKECDSMTDSGNEEKENQVDKELYTAKKKTVKITNLVVSTVARI